MRAREYGMGAVTCGTTDNITPSASQAIVSGGVRSGFGALTALSGGCLGERNVVVGVEDAEKC